MASDMRKLLATDLALSDPVLAIQYWVILCYWLSATDYWLTTECYEWRCRRADVLELGQISVPNGCQSSGMHDVYFKFITMFQFRFTEVLPWPYLAGLPAGLLESL